MVWDFLLEMFSSNIGTVSSMDDVSSTTINPATGLPMIDDGMGGLDVGGSPFGMDIHSNTDSFGGSLSSNPWD